MTPNNAQIQTQKPDVGCGGGLPKSPRSRAAPRRTAFAKTATVNTAMWLKERAPARGLAFFMCGCCGGQRARPA